MGTTTGYIALADISGYTTFVAATELEHSREILSELLEVTSRALERHLVPVRLQGDAIICVGSQDEVVACLEAAFTVFHRRVRAMVAVTTCPCAACRTVPSLTLKFVVHHGEYSNVEVRGTKDLVGAEVNVAFRLLKNHVPSHEYILITQPVLGRLPEAVRERYRPIVEEYDIGRVEAYYRDLHELRDQAGRPAPPPVTRRDAHVSVATMVTAAPSVVWELLKEARTFEQILAAPHVDLQPGARGTMQGAEYHCHHGKDAETVFEVVDLREPSVITLWIYGNGPEAHGTYHLDRLADGRTRVEFDIRFTDATGIRLLVTRALWSLFIFRGMRALRRLTRERSAALAPS